MIICEKCFCDEEIVSVIQSHAQKGVCSVCGSEGVYIYDTDKCDDLSVMFDELIDIYTPQSSLPDTYPKSEIKVFFPSIKLATCSINASYNLMESIVNW